MVNLNQLRGIPFETNKLPSASSGNFDKYGRVIRSALAPCKDKTVHIVTSDAKPQLIFDQDCEEWKVKCGEKIFPLFDEKQGLTGFQDDKGKRIHYDHRIPVKEGEEPYKEVIDGKTVIKFGPDHRYTMPYESKNGETYEQMKYEKGGTVGVYKSKESYDRRNSSQISIAQRVRQLKQPSKIS